jgi:hypothetical protein
MADVPIAVAVAASWSASPRAVADVTVRQADLHGRWQETRPGGRVPTRLRQGASEPGDRCVGTPLRVAEEATARLHVPAEVADVGEGRLGGLVVAPQAVQLTEVVARLRGIHRDAATQERDSLPVLLLSLGPSAPQLLDLCSVQVARTRDLRGRRMGRDHRSNASVHCAARRMSARAWHVMIELQYTHTA